METIYALIDPRDSQIHYIGQTNDMRKRLYGHIKDAPNSTTPKDAWVRELLDCGYEPVMIDLQRVQNRNWWSEESWITLLTALGAPIKNVRPAYRKIGQHSVRRFKDRTSADLTKINLDILWAMVEPEISHYGSYYWKSLAYREYLARTIGNVRLVRS